MEWHRQAKVAIIYGVQNPTINPKLYSSIGRNVSDIQSTGKSPLEVSRSYIMDTSALSEVKVISQPKGVALNNRTTLVYYDDPTAGECTGVYVFDTEARVEHEVSFNRLDSVVVLAAPCL